MESETVLTERLHLKKFTPEAFTYLFQHFDEEQIKKELGLFTHEEFLKEKKKAEDGYKTYDRTIIHFKLILKETGEVIGGAGFHNWYPDHNKAELGYALNKDEHKQKGYMSEAVKAILDYGFSKMNLNRVEACVGPAKRSWKWISGPLASVSPFSRKNSKRSPPTG